MAEVLMLKEIGKRLLGRAGLEIRRIHAAGSHLRPIGRSVSVLQDARARRFVPRVIFDVGASDGSWTRSIEHIFPDAAVVLVEPRPAMLPALTALCRANPRYSAIAAAVGRVPGNATLTDWDTGSTLLPVEAGDAPQLSVPVVTLDMLASRSGNPDIVKLDIEGFELEALRGASHVLGSTELFIIEVALFRFEDRPMLHDIVAFMADHRYFVYDFGDFVRRPFDGALGLIDLCFARGQGVLRQSERAWHHT